jgi:hypothetical protein
MTANGEKKNAQRRPNHRIVGELLEFEVNKALRIVPILYDDCDH